MAIPFAIKFDQHISTIPKAELLRACSQLIKKDGSFQKSNLMRSFILNERDFMEIDYIRGIRRFWYMAIKPALDKLGLLTSNDITDAGLKKWDSTLSKYIANLVRAGELTYQDLNIIDDSRKMELPSNVFQSISLRTYGAQISAADHPNIILCCEKDTIFEHIRKIASLFGCSCISGKGQNAFAAMEKLLRGMPFDVENIHILTFTDYDPAGYSISGTFKKQALDHLSNLGLDSKVHSERIGITLDQLTPDEILNNQYTPKSDGQGQKTINKKWMELTGGINGEFKGLELDALSPDRVRTIFATSLKSYLDPKQYSRFVKKSYIRMRVLQAIQANVNVIVDEITSQEIDNIDLFDFDVFELAEEGHSSIPIDSLCSADRDNSINQMSRAFFK